MTSQLIALTLAQKIIIGAAGTIGAHLVGWAIIRLWKRLRSRRDPVTRLRELRQDRSPVLEKPAKAVSTPAMTIGSSAGGNAALRRKLDKHFVRRKETLTEEGVLITFPDGTKHLLASDPGSKTTKERDEEPAQKRANKIVTDAYKRAHEERRR